MLRELPQMKISTAPVLPTRSLGSWGQIALAAPFAPACSVPLLHYSKSRSTVASILSSSKHFYSMFSSRVCSSWRSTPFLNPSPLPSSSTSPRSPVFPVRPSRREKAWPILASRRQQQQDKPATKKRPERRKDAPEKRDARSVKKPLVEGLPNTDFGLAKPPAGFVVDTNGKVLMASNKRITTIVDPADNLPLDCVIRRVFQSSRGDECMLLCPADTPVFVLRSSNFEGWLPVPDDEIEGILPAVAYALAKIHMHLVNSGFCYTARGGFCCSEDDVFDFGFDDSDDIQGVPTEGIEVTCFNQDGAHYMIYTPREPMLFVAIKNQDGILQIAEDAQLEDPAVIAAIQEENDFDTMVEEELDLLDSLAGKKSA